MSSPFLFVPFNPSLKSGTDVGAISNALQKLADDYQAQGYEYVRTETIVSMEQPGCLASLFGASAVVFSHNIAVFRYTGQVG